MIKNEKDKTETISVPIFSSSFHLVNIIQKRKKLYTIQTKVNKF